MKEYEVKINETLSYTVEGIEAESQEEAISKAMEQFYAGMLDAHDADLEGTAYEVTSQGQVSSAPHDYTPELDGVYVGDPTDTEHRATSSALRGDY